jgi:gliding motility-associated lipoprotein GldH
MSVQAPGGITRNRSVELKLATDDKGWLGSGMDDIYEHRVLVNTAGPEPLIAGTYHFTLENIMRDDPLDHVMNIGIRLEKVN